MKVNTQNLESSNRASEATPNFLWTLAFVEMWERFSYYGMRSLLVLYLISFMKMQDNVAYDIYAVFGTFSYMLCVLFGTLADKYLGPRNTVKVGGLVMLIGHALMAVSHQEGYNDLIFMALGLICVGTGAFKGNITNILGMCYNKNPGYNKDAGYTLFYVSVNLGAFLSAMTCGQLGQDPNYGWGYGFGLAGIGMAIGLIVLQLRGHTLGNAGEMPEEYKSKQMTIVLSFFAGVLFLSYYVAYILKYATEIRESHFLNVILIGIIGWYLVQLFKDVEYRKNNLMIFLVSFFTMIFYILEMQLGGLLKVFIDRNVNLSVNLFDFKQITFMSSQIESINSGVIMFFGFVLGMSKMKDNENGFYRFLFGLASIPLCFVLLYMGCIANVDGLVPFSYVFWAFAIMAVGETFIGPMSQSQLSKFSNPNKRGLSFGFFMFFLGASNLLGGIVSKYFAIDANNVDDKLLTLEVYKEGFMKIIIWNLVFVAIFLILIPFMKKLYRDIIYKDQPV